MSVKNTGRRPAPSQCNTTFKKLKRLPSGPSERLLIRDRLTARERNAVRVGAMKRLVHCVSVARPACRPRQLLLAPMFHQLRAEVSDRQRSHCILPAACVASNNAIDGKCELVAANVTGGWATRGVDSKISPQEGMPRSAPPSSDRRGQEGASGNHPAAAAPSLDRNILGGAVKAGEGRCAPTRPSLFLTCAAFPAVAFLTPAHPVDRETGVTPAPCQPNHLRCAQLTRQGTRADPRGPAGRYGRR